MERLERAGIPSLPVKGALLANQLYDSPAERPLVDVDLLVLPRDFGRTVRLLRSLGLPLVWDSKQLGNVNVIVDGAAVDIASSLGPPGTSAIGVDALLLRATREHAPLGFPHWQIDWHDHVLLVAIDAFKDKLGSKPSSREDLRRMAALPAFVPARLVERAREARLRTLLAVVAAWVLEGGEVPGFRDVLAELGTDGVRDGYARTFRWLSAKRDSRWSAIPLALLARAASDSPSRRLAALALGGAGTLAFVGRNRGLRVAPPKPPARSS